MQKYLNPVYKWPGTRIATAQSTFLAIAVLAISLGVYLRTLAPSITWKNGGADGGDLVTAAFTGGIPHPPGYPLYTTLARILIAIPVGGVAYRVNLLSALAAAATVVALYAVIQSFLITDRGWKGVVALTTALYFAFTPLFWSQATIAEVYTLNAFLTILVLLGFLLWSQASESTQAETSAPLYASWLVAVALGLGLAHHLTILFILPGGFVLLWGRTRFRTLLRALAVSLIIGGTWYLTLFLRASLDSPTSWSYPKTPADLWWIVSAQLYRGYVFGIPWADYPLRLSAWAKFLFNQFGAIGVALGLWGSIRLVRRAPRAGIAMIVTFAVYSVFAIGYDSVDSDVYLIPAYLVFTLGIAEALSALIASLIHHASESGWLKSAYPLILGFGLCLFPLLNGAQNFEAVDLSQDTEALDYGRRAFEIMPDNALVVTDNTGEHIFSLWYHRYVEHPESRVVIVVPSFLSFAWYRQQLERHNPNWIWPESPGLQWDSFLNTLIAKNIDRHPVFWTSPDPEFQQIFQFRSMGPLYQTLMIAKP